MDCYKPRENFSYAEKQELTVPLSDADPHDDLEMLLGREFGHFSSKAEKLLWATLSRTPVQNFPNGPTSALTECTFFVSLPLEKSMDLIVTHKLDSQTFEFCEGLPVNLSLNARLAALFYQ